MAMGLAQKLRPGDTKFAEALLYLTTDVLHITNWAIRYKSHIIGCASYYLASVWSDEKVSFDFQSTNSVLTSMFSLIPILSVEMRGSAKLTNL